MPIVLKPDPFNAVLLSSPPLLVTDEQKMYIRKVLDKACSDSRFAEKAYIAITGILNGTISKPPVITSLTPNSAEIGDASFTLHVHGTDLKNTDVIVFAGQEEPTTFVSATELTTGVDMSVWVGPDALPVAVLASNGVMSDAMTFTFTDGSVGALSQKKVVEVPVKEPVLKTEEKKDNAH